MAKRTKSYGLNNPLQDVFPGPVLASRNPTTNDRNYELGQAWVNTSANTIFGLTSVVSNSATWSLLGPGASDVDTLTGDGGGAISPAAGNITLAGGTNITTAGGGSTITFNLDAAISLATSVTSPIYTTSAADMNINSAAGQDILMQMGDAGGANKISFEDNASVEVATLDSDGTLTVVEVDGVVGANTASAGTFTTVVANTSVTSPIYTSTGAVDTNINALAGQDTIMKMGDNAGANKVSFTDSDDAEVFAIDSNGGITTLTALTVTGAFTQTAGAVLIGQDNAANAIDIAGGNVARAVTLLSGAAAHTLAVGSASAGAITVDTAAGISLDGATASNFTVTGAADLTIGTTAGGLDLSAGEAAADAISLDASNAAGGVTIAAGTGGLIFGNQADCTTIDLGNQAPGATRTTTIGGGTVIVAAVTDTIDIGPDGATTNANSIKTVNVNTGGVTTGQVLTNIASGTVTSGTHTTEIATGNRAAGTMALNIMTGTGTKITNLGNADAATTLNIDAVTLINDSINAATSINTGSSTGAVTIGNAAAGAIGIDTDAAFTINADDASTINVSAGTLDLDASGALSINSSAGVINIGDDAIAQDMNFGTGAAQRNIILGNATGTTSVVVNIGTGAASFGANATVHTTTLGSTSGAADTIIQAGTGNITMTGTIEQVNAKEVNVTGFDITMLSSPTTCTSADTAGVATGATGNTNLLQFAQGIVMEQFIVGAGQTIIKPVMDASGLLCSLDLVATEGVEYNFGIARALSEYAFTIGTSAAFFFEVEMTVADVSGGLPYIIGFRKAEANNADYTAYTDYYSLGMITGTSAANVTITSELNGTGQNLQNSGDAWTGGDGGTTTLRALVSAAGVCTATIDGAGPSTPLVYTFDNTDVVGPYIRLVHGAAAPGAIHIVSMRCGFQ